MPTEETFGYTNEEAGLLRNPPSIELRIGGEQFILYTERPPIDWSKDCGYDYYRAARKVSAHCHVLTSWKGEMDIVVVRGNKAEIMSSDQMAAFGAELIAVARDLASTR